MLGWILFKNTENKSPLEKYSTRRFIEIAQDMGIHIQVLKPEQFDIVVTKEDRKSILLDGQPTPLPDFVLPRMGAGITYYGLALIRHLEKLGVPTFNTSESIDIVRDKLFTTQILASNGLPVPKTLLTKFPVDLDLIEQKFGFPVVVKTISGSQGSGVFLSETRDNLQDLMQFIQENNKQVHLVIQEFIAASRGRDLRVFVIGGKVVACMQRKASDGNFKANYSRGGGVEAYPISQLIENLADEIVKLFRLDIAGIDLLFDKEGGFRVCEVNSCPGFEGLESCCDVSIPHEIYDYVIRQIKNKQS